jgi:hypothetical protein
MIYSPSQLTKLDIFSTREVVHIDDPDQTLLNLAAILRVHELFHLTDPSYVPPQIGEDQAPTTRAQVATNAADVRSYQEKRQKFIRLVTVLLSPTVSNTVFNDTDEPSVIWAKITDWLSSTDTSSLVDLRQDFHTLNLVNFPSVRAFSTKVLGHARKIGKKEGAAMPNSAISDVLLNGVPHKETNDDYHAIVTAMKRELDLQLRNTDGNLRCTPQYIIQQLILRESQLNSSATQLDERLNNAQALLSAHGRYPSAAPARDDYNGRGTRRPAINDDRRFSNNNNNRRNAQATALPRTNNNNDRSGRPARNRRERTCYYCGSSDHLRNACKELRDTLAHRMAEIDSNIQNENAQVATAGLTANAHVPTTASQRQEDEGW